MSATGAPARVAATDRVLDVLARDEALVEVFVRHSSRLATLRSPAMRRVMARLVTIEQAATIAGIAADALVRDLNAALGVPHQAEEVSPAQRAITGDDASTASRQMHPADAPTVELDLRADMRAGREPFSRIMAAVATLDDGWTLRLRTIFEPVPLFALLAKRGFVHESRQAATEDWFVWFWRAATPADVATTAAPSDDVPHDGEVWLDVRGLTPPEPMLRTLAALETLPEGHQLVQVNVRVPQLLLPVLAERGYAWELDETQGDRVLVRIRRIPRAGSPLIHLHHPTPTGENHLSLQPIELDVRVIPPRDKHPAIFRTFDTLASGQSLVLLNDHDPKPLRYQLLAERPDSFDWAYEAEGPDLWKVRISRR